MTHKLKNVCYQNISRKILLQNENGPCPLLAVANILLLRGSIDLPASCIHNNVATTSDVITMLANRALSRCTNTSSTSSSDNNNNNNKLIEDEEEAQRILLKNKQSQYEIDELMSILPKLQYGLDVNPKFTCGVEGYEYTQGVATLFDMLGVDLVHGWLVDPQEEELHALLRNKSYNECVEMVIRANDVTSHFDKHSNTQQDITKKKDKDETKSEEEEDDNDDEAWVDVQAPKKEKDSTINSEETPSLDSNEEKAQKTIKEGNLINTFLTQSSHQLTYYGLHTLHTHIKNNTLSVFFRNNHFSTITKHDDHLFLLVTDLGYAHNSTAIWERLDNIDGDSDYFDSFFQLMTYDETKNDATNTDTENIDYQLALQLSKETSSITDHTNNNSDSNNNYTQAILPPLVQTSNEELALSNNIPTTEQPNNNICNNLDSNTTNNNLNYLDQVYAYELQAQYEADAASELLARKLQQEEEDRIRNTHRNRPVLSSAPRTASSSNNAQQKSCVIS